MKKRIIFMTAISVLCAGTVLGCSKQENRQAENVNAENKAVVEEQQPGEEISEIMGTLDEIKDFMFIVTDENRISYAFSFEEQPEGFSKVRVGDNVTVTYTGTISEIDPFVGKVLSVEKQ